MANIVDAYNNAMRFINGFENEIKSVMNRNAGEVREYITEQLYSGVNGRDRPLRPTYINDPWFNTDESGKWKNNPKKYAQWKRRITSPVPSYLGYPARDWLTPNLIITGEFYDSIRVYSSGEGLKIETRGTGIGADIERKYGSVILGVGSKSRAYFIKNILTPALKNYYSKFGL